MDRLIEFTNNNLLLVAGSVLMALAVVFYELRQRAQSVFEVTPLQAVRLINQGARVIDVRSPENFSSGHINGSLNLPGGDMTQDAGKKLKKNKPVVLVCDNGLTSARCIEPLRKAGFESAFSLQGGLTAWRRDNLPLFSETASQGG
jgi:rhodanese-related sulfurtransferase